jgi:hypothetical protein
MEWLKALYDAIGAPFPVLSQLLAIILGATIFGGGWWLIGREYRKDHPPNLKTGETASAPAANFKITMLGGNFFVPDKRPDLTGIALDVRIRNAGIPSIATDWALKVVLPDGTSIRPQLTKMPKTLTLKGQSGVVALSSSESLDSTTFSRNIDAGNPAEGQLLFYTPTPKSVIVNPHTILVLSVQDVAGKIFSATQEIGSWLR